MIIIHGAANGADTIAGMAAKELGLEVMEFPAEWSKHGKRAGPIRNQQMLDEGRPNGVIAFHEDISRSKGTKHMIKIAKKNNIPVLILGS